MKCKFFESMILMTLTIGMVSINGCDSTEVFARPDSPTPTTKTEATPVGVPVLKLGDYDVFNEPVLTSVDGHLAKAITVASAQFETDELVPAHLRNLSNYTVEVRKVKTRYYVLFDARLAKDEKPRLGGETSLGKDTMYAVNADDFKVVGRAFFK